MRAMEIPCVPEQIEINDLEHLYKTRLQQKLEVHAAIAIPLLGYMGWPNDPAAREDAAKMLRAWLDGEEPREFLKQIPPMHQDWGRVAGAVLLHRGLGEGGHRPIRRCCERMFWWRRARACLRRRSRSVRRCRVWSNGNG